LVGLANLILLWRLTAVSVGMRTIFGLEEHPGWVYSDELYRRGGGPSGEDP
jgi:hypothetical protein